jgi:crossover junction endodeoxyribonuclease RuvC
MVIVDSLGSVVAMTKLRGTKAVPVTDHDLFEMLSEHDPAFAVLEKVHAMPRQGVSSSFKFGDSFGTCRTLLSCARVPYELVTPQRWQKSMGCRTGGDKRISRDAAQRLHPRIRVTHWNADALLLAEYARRLHNSRKI